MSDQAYENALKRRAELQAELAETEDFLRLWTRFAHYGMPAETGNFVVEGNEANLIVTRRPPPTKDNKPRRGLRREEIGRVAKEMMVTSGRPMTRSELVAAFKERGLPVGGSDPERNMGTIMWRLKGDFVNIEGHGYWPWDLDYVPAGYRAMDQLLDTSPVVIEDDGIHDEDNGDDEEAESAKPAQGSSGIFS